MPLYIILVVVWGLLLPASVRGQRREHRHCCQKNRSPRWHDLLIATAAVDICVIVASKMETTSLEDLL
jgi:hypothetical protein